MELNNIEILIEDYFNGKTSLAQEKLLKRYFSNEDVAEHLKIYQPIFKGFEIARKEEHNAKLSLENSKRRYNGWWYSAAAIIIVAVTMGGIYFSESALSKEEEEALAAYKKAQQSMLLLSENLNKGTQKLDFLFEFNKGAENLKIINRFNETKNRILK